MDANPVEQALKELLPYLEDLETRSQAALQLLKDRERITDEQLAPYLERAAQASSVKWRAARVRMEYLLSTVSKKDEPQGDKQPVQKAAFPQEGPADKKPKSKPQPAAEQSPQQDAA